MAMSNGTAPNGEYARFDLPSSGTWLPLTDAAREASIMRRVIYRLVGDGKLRSREGANGEIEIWVRDDDRVNEIPVSSSEVTGTAVVAAVTERAALTSGHELAALLAPLSASHERNVQLAHENGSLKERTAILERDLTALQDSNVFDKRALQLMTERLRALEERQTQMTRTSPEVDQRPSRGSAWWLLWLVPGVLLCAAVAAIWLVGWPL